MASLHVAWTAYPFTRINRSTRSGSGVPGPVVGIGSPGRGDCSIYGSWGRHLRGNLIIDIRAQEDRLACRQQPLGHRDALWPSGTAAGVGTHRPSLGTRSTSTPRPCMSVGSRRARLRPIRSVRPRRARLRPIRSVRRAAGAARLQREQDSVLAVVFTSDCAARPSPPLASGE
jgi:hypothetical protein